MSEATASAASRGRGTGRRMAIAFGVSLAIVLAGNVSGPTGYPWLKAFHVVAVISWMAGLLYLPRLFVYHAAVPVGSAQSETFKVMEFRLAEYIMTPAMVASWTAGLWLAWDGFSFGGGWLHAKLAAVVLLTVSHGLLMRSVAEFRGDRNHRSTTWFRVVNEIPTLLMIAIVILVVVKPF